VPEEVPFNLDVYCHEGALARTVADCALFENVISGPDIRDMTCLSPKLDIPEELEGIEGMKIALVVTLPDLPIDADVAANTRAAAAAFAEAGAIVEEVELPVGRDVLLNAVMIHFGAIFGAQIMGEVEAHRELLNPYTVAMAERSVAAFERSSFAEGLMLESAILTALGEVFSDHQVLLAPTLLTRGFIAGDDYVDHGLTIGDEELDDWVLSMLTPLFNVASRCPVLNVPSGFADNGVPTGLQIAGRPYEDVTVFRAAAAFERLRPWLDVSMRRPLQTVAR
jgi:Asp-tRNA(Asn)/Glu-tRNA(Gln) amidotransferase A subunit family amidase